MNSLRVEVIDNPSDVKPLPDATILIVEDDMAVRRVLAGALEIDNHYEIHTVTNGREALELIEIITPDLIITDIMMPVMNGYELLTHLRADPRTADTTVILLTAYGEVDDVVKGFDLGADDYLTKPLDIHELRARVRGRLKRPSIDADHRHGNQHTGVLSAQTFLTELERENLRTRQRQIFSCLAIITLHELVTLKHQFGNIDQLIAEQLVELVEASGSSLEVMGRDANGNFMLLLPEIETENAQIRLRNLARAIAAHNFRVRDDHIRLTPVIGFTRLDADHSGDELYTQAITAMEFASGQLDLQPMLYQPRMKPAHAAEGDSLKKMTVEFRRTRWWHQLRDKTRTINQIVATMILSILAPFAIYVLLGAHGYQASQAVYLFVVVALLGTAGVIWVEGFLALHIDKLPPARTAYPMATAIIAAYLPNEAATVVATIEAFLCSEYPGKLQIILAYNTPNSMPIEAELRALAQHDSRFTALNVKGSTSKAQNVNAALAYARGEFIGIFDADHQPAPDSFTRAWHWLDNGFDVVQGHCLIRNGDTSPVARTIAIEFEGIYAVSHPGRTRLHQFGIFGGSNGYWRTELLHATRMHGFMLTEDIDSSLRVVSAGYKIKTDPQLISRELAPTTWSALWDQRMRWAQGWFQVSLKYGPSGLFNSGFTLRQKMGIFHLLIWREIYPWISVQIIPIIAYWAWLAGGMDKIEWLVPIFLVTSLITLGTGPAQLLFILRVGDKTITERTGWFLRYLLISFFYTEYKNIIGRVAQIKEISGERKWKVTPRG